MKNILSFFHNKNKVSIKKILFIILLVYLFLLAIGLMSTSFKLMGSSFSSALIAKTTNPIVALFIGILATSLIQSSSSTTSIIIGLIAAGSLELPSAIALIMGANIGTSITNLLVAISYFKNTEEFYFSFKAASLHAIYNIMTVLILFPLELNFHFLEKSARFITSHSTFAANVNFPSILKIITKPLINFITIIISNPYFLLILSFLLLYFSLKTITKTAKSQIKFTEKNNTPKTVIVYKKLFQNPLKSFSTGLGITFFLQSSSVTTSLIIPFSALRVLTLKEIFPYSLGANIGTTLTPFMAAIATGNIVALTLSFVHILFNILGAIIAIPLYKLPIRIAKVVARSIYFHKTNAIIYIISVFFIIPTFIIFLLI